MQARIEHQYVHTHAHTHTHYKTNLQHVLAVMNGWCFWTWSMGRDHLCKHADHMICLF